MARLESKVDLMHVATPAVVCERLRDFLAIPENCVALDPCCGTGEALATILSGRGRGFGVELDLRRAKEAEKRLHKVMACAVQDARISNGTFGLVFCNPPYDDSMNGRLENVFLERCLRYLKPGGVLVFVVKHSHYTGATCRKLAEDCEDFLHWRFPDPFFDGPDLAYRQTVLICRRKRDGSSSGDPKIVAELRYTLGKQLDPFFPDVNALYAVPPGNMPGIFVPGELSPELILDIMQSSPIARTPPKRGDLYGRPPLPLKVGHQALLLASGAIDGVYCKEADGSDVHVAKGTVRRSERKEKMLAYDNRNQPTVLIRETMGFEIIVRTLTPDGVIHDVTPPPPEEPPVEIVDPDELERKTKAVSYTHLTLPTTERV